MEYAVHRLTTEVSRVFKDTHIQTLISASHDNTISMSELFRMIGNRLRDERWIVVLKSLSLIHLLTREGNSNRLLGYLCSNTDLLYQSFFRQHGPVSTKIIKGYSAYLEEKAGAYRILKYDWVRQQDEAVAKFRSLDDEVQLIRDSELLQKQIQAALGCAWEVDSTTDVVIQQCFRFILAEYFNLFLLSNESIVKVLGLYFQMERRNATKALELYKTFVLQTKRLQDVFQSAKQNLPMRVEIPSFNVPPVGLVSKLEDYLNSPDHEEKRLAAKAGKTYQSSKTEENNFSLAQPPSFTSPRKASMAAVNTKEKPLIDFFNSVEEEYESQATTSPAFSTGWDDQFSQQAAMQSTIQSQIQQTSQLLYSGGGLGQHQTVAAGGFQQNAFSASAQFPQQNIGFSGLNTNNFASTSTSNPFTQSVPQSQPADPFSTLSGPSNNNQFFAANQGQTSAFPNAPNNSFVSNTGTFNNFAGAAGSKSFASSVPPAASTGFGHKNMFASPMIPNSSGVIGQQQHGNANPFMQPIHNPAAFAVNDTGSNNMQGMIPNSQYMPTQSTGNSLASSNNNINPFSSSGMSAGMMSNAFSGNNNAGSFRQLPSSAMTHMQLQNQGTSSGANATSVASQFHAANLLTNNNLGGGYTTSAPRAAGFLQSQQPFQQPQQNTGMFATNGAFPGQQQPQLQQASGNNSNSSNNNPFF